MKPTQEVLSTFSNYCYAMFTLYKFNEGSLKVTDKYREGRLAGIEYAGDLVFHYLQEEKKIRDKVVEQINRQMKENACLNESEYKDGLYDALNEALDEYRKIDVVPTKIK